MRDIRFGVQADMGRVGGTAAWLDLARRVEGLGFDGLYVADHVGVGAAPFSPLAAAAGVTSTLRLGTYVLNCGVRDPLATASEVATLDQLSGGRVVVGLGAGHTPAEWTMSGHGYPTAADRVGRLEESAAAVAALLAGEVVTLHGRHLDLDEAFLSEPRPVQARVPVLVGGNGRRVLELAGREADVVGLTGLGRTLEDGHRHEVDWRPDAIDERVAIVRRAAASRSVAPVLDALVQHVEVTNDLEAAAERCARLAPGMTPADVVGAPYALVGSLEQIVDELFHHRTRWGISSYVVRSDAIEAVASIIERLAR